MIKKILTLNETRAHAALTLAVHLNDEEAVERALKQGANPNSFNDKNLLPWMSINDLDETAAAERIAQRLIDAGFEPNGVDHDDVSILHNTLAYGASSTAVRLLIKAGADPMQASTVYWSGDTMLLYPLEYTLALENFTLFNTLMDLQSNGVKPCAINPEHGYTALHWACQDTNHVPERCAAIERLIQAGADVDLPSTAGDTPRQMVANWPELSTALSQAVVAREQGILRQTLGSTADRPKVARTRL